MKSINIFAFVVVIGIFGLASCKPKEKETAVSGQVFIVTKGAENIKLGAVEVLLIEKSQITDFLKKKQHAIDLEMSSKRQDLKNAEQEVSTALGNADKAQAYFNWFTEDKPYKTNLNYLKARSEWTNLFKLYVRQTNDLNQLNDERIKLSKAPSSDVKVSNFLSVADKCMAAIKKREEMAKNLNLLHDQYKAIEMDALSTERDKREIVKSVLSKAISHSDELKSIVNNSPTTTDYLCDFSPSCTTKTISDADGKFSVTYPAGIQFSIYAKAQRFTPNKTEVYYWLVDAPTNDNQKFLLYNSNLATVDPDSYFKIKPKEN